MLYIPPEAHETYLIKYRVTRRIRYRYNAATEAILMEGVMSTRLDLAIVSTLAPSQTMRLGRMHEHN